jgi:hypothetical protein
VKDVKDEGDDPSSLRARDKVGERRTRGYLEEKEGKECVFEGVIVCCLLLYSLLNHNVQRRVAISQSLTRLSRRRSTTYILL